jgi:tetratricopeptide (TPR) repeat protein
LVPLVLAPYHELTGNLKEAEKEYKAALTARPDDLALLNYVSGYYLRSGRLIEAEAVLRRILDPRLKASEADLVSARRGLALAMALSPSSDTTHFQEALRLLEENLQRNGPNAEDLRAKGSVLATRPNHRREAIRLFEELLGRKALPADEQFLLAQLYAEDNEWQKARERLLLLLSQDRDNPRYLAYYACALVRHGEVDEAETWLRRLERLESTTLRTVEVRLRVLKARNRENEAMAALLPYVQTRGANLPVVGGLLNELGMGAAAKDLYDKYLQPSARPENLVPYIRYLSGQKRLTEALDQCERAWTLCPLRTAATLSVDVLRGNGPSNEQCRRVDGWLKAALQKKPSNPDALFLLICQCQLWEQQGQFTEVEAQYRRILAQDPGNVLALNNLAWFLARRLGQGSEAMSLIEQAIQRKGPLAELLDTRAAVYLTLGRPERAVRDMQDALAQSQTAVGFFHLAEACSKANNRRAAVEAWRKAKEAGLTVEALHPLEKSIYAQLLADLDTETSPPGKS